MSSHPARLAAYLALAERAAKGPWKHNAYGSMRGSLFEYTESERGGYDFRSLINRDDACMGEDDAKFCVAARTEGILLLKEMAEENKSLKEMLEKVWDYAKHGVDCPRRHFPPDEQLDVLCDCGLDALVQEDAALTEGQEDA